MILNSATVNTCDERVTAACDNVSGRGDRANSSTEVSRQDAYDGRESCWQGSYLLLCASPVVVCLLIRISQSCSLRDVALNPCDRGRCLDRNEQSFGLVIIKYTAQ